MNLREALIAQAPSLELQRAAQSEIARLDHQLRQANELIREVYGLVRAARGADLDAAVGAVAETLRPYVSPTPGELSNEGVAK